MQSITEFIERWKHLGGSEHASCGLFLNDLAEVLGLEKPLPVTDTDQNDRDRLERTVVSAIIGDNSKKNADLDRLTLPSFSNVKLVGMKFRWTANMDLAHEFKRPLIEVIY